MQMWQNMQMFLQKNMQSSKNQTMFVVVGFVLLRCSFPFGNLLRNLGFETVRGWNHESLPHGPNALRSRNSAKKVLEEKQSLIEQGVEDRASRPLFFFGKMRWAEVTLLVGKWLIGSLVVWNSGSLRQFAWFQTRKPKYKVQIITFWWGHLEKQNSQHRKSCPHFYFFCDAWAPSQVYIWTNGSCCEN